MEHTESEPLNSFTPDGPDEGGDNGDQAKESRGRSTIVFPYDHLASAERVAQAVHEKHGGHCEMDQLAAALDQKPASGGFRLKVSAARIFGLISTSPKGGIDLTGLGARLLDGQTAVSARVEAFLSVPLYSRLYETYRNGILPGDTGLEAKIRELGVTDKQVATARQVFQRSATQAGFFASGKDRLVKPSTGRMGADAPPANGGADNASPSFPPTPPEKPSVKDHPLIVGLLEALPEPGTEYPDEDRKEWLEAVKINLNLIYRRSKNRDPASVPSPHQYPTGPQPLS